MKAIIPPPLHYLAQLSTNSSVTAHMAPSILKSQRSGIAPPRTSSCRKKIVEELLLSMAEKQHIIYRLPRGIVMQKLKRRVWLYCVQRQQFFLTYIWILSVFIAALC